MLDFENLFKIFYDFDNDEGTPSNFKGILPYPYVSRIKSNRSWIKNELKKPNITLDTLAKIAYNIETDLYTKHFIKKIASKKPRVFFGAVNTVAMIKYINAIRALALYRKSFTNPIANPLNNPLRMTTSLSSLNGENEEITLTSEDFQTVIRNDKNTSIKNLITQGLKTVLGNEFKSYYWIENESKKPYAVTYHHGNIPLDFSLRKTGASIKISGKNKDFIRDCLIGDEENIKASYRLQDGKIICVSNKKHENLQRLKMLFSLINDYHTNSAGILKMRNFLKSNLNINDLNRLTLSQLILQYEKLLLGLKHIAYEHTSFLYDIYAKSSYISQKGRAVWTQHFYDLLKNTPPEQFTLEQLEFIIHMKDAEDNAPDPQPLSKTFLDTSISIFPNKNQTPTKDKEGLSVNTSTANQEEIKHIETIDIEFSSTTEEEFFNTEENDDDNNNEFSLTAVDYAGEYAVKQNENEITSPPPLEAKTNKIEKITYSLKKYTHTYESNYESNNDSESNSESDESEDISASNTPVVSPTGSAAVSPDTSPNVSPDSSPTTPPRNRKLHPYLSHSHPQELFHKLAAAKKSPALFQAHTQNTKNKEIPTLTRKSLLAKDRREKFERTKSLSQEGQNHGKPGWRR